MNSLMKCALGLVLASGAAVAVAQDDERMAPEPVRLELQAEDGQAVLGWWSEAAPDEETEQQRAARRAKAPVVVLLHMYLSDHGAWDPLLPELLERGVSVLALDLRGHGENRYGPADEDGEREDLAERAKAADAGLFNAMHQDALAAVDHLVELGFDEAHVGLLGASVGCSVAIDTARRRVGLRVAGTLTPGTAYLGVDTMKHVEGWGTRRLLIVSSEEERGIGADPIDDALQRQHAERLAGLKDGRSTALVDAPRSPAELWILDETGVHGTRMFGKVEGIEARIATWFAAALEPAAAPAAERPTSRPVGPPE